MNGMMAMGLPSGVQASATKLQERLNSKIRCEVLHGDGSNRTFYRLHAADDSYILMSLPPDDREKLAAEEYDWLKIADNLRSAHINVPRVIDVHAAEGCLIVEDCGDDLLQEVINGSMAGNHKPDLVHQTYKDTFAIIKQFLAIKPTSEARWTQRAFDEALFTRELNFFETHFVRGMDKIAPTNAEKNQFTTDIKAISQFLAGFSKYFVHRDFHSRNLIRKNGRVFVIDFQDARLGPLTYDMVSLAFDPYVTLSFGLRHEIFETQRAIVASTLSLEARKILEDTWRATLLQRQLKVLGSFAYLTKLKPFNYMGYVPAAVESLIKADLFDRRWPYISGLLLQSIGRHYG